MLIFITTIVDFGLVILIWMTQLIVYPSFTFFREEDLVRWHGRYTSAVFYFVMPLMLGQGLLHFLGIYFDFEWWRLISVVLISMTWVNTFIFAVPLHRKIANGSQVLDSAKALVKLNWYRTAFWSLVFLISLYATLKSQGLFY